MAKERIPIRDARGHVVGAVVGDVFEKPVDADRHMLLVPMRSWASDVVALKMAEEAGATAVLCRDRKTGTTWRAPLAAFWTYGQVVNRRYGEQLALTLERWQVARPGAPTQLTLPLRA